MQLRNLVPATLLAFSLLIAGGSLATHARDEQNAGRQAALNGLNVAVVDMDRVYDASDGPQLVQTRATETFRELQQQETRIMGVPYLEQQELGEFINLLVAPNPTPEQQARLDALKKLSDQRAQDLDVLQHKKDADLTKDDRKRVLILQTASNELQNQMPKIDALLNNDRKERLVAFQNEQMIRLRGVVGKVAQAHGIMHVFGSSALIYSVNDITNEVIQKVGKHK